MATSVNPDFQSMLNEYLPNSMLEAEFIKRDWVLSNIEIDNGWVGSKIIVPFRGSSASSVEFGQLASSADISQSKFVRGSIDNYVEVWSSLILDQRDLYDHTGKMSEASFLKILPNEVDNLLTYFKEVVSTNLLNGTHFATITVDGTAGGVFQVDHIDRFTVGQKFDIDDGNSAATSVYVINVDTNGGTVTASGGSITVSLTRGGVAASMTAYTVAQIARCYHPGVLANGGFNSIRATLLSAANGGSATVHGVVKTAWPILQATNISGAALSSTNILTGLFDAYTEVRRKGRGNATNIVMSFKHLGSIMKILENQKGAFVVTKAPSTSLYGWTEIEVTTVRGAVKIIGVFEMDDDVIFFLDLKSMTFRTRGSFKKRMSPDGKEFFEIRATTGYSYVIDQSIFGELEVSKPCNNAVIYGINY